jgi:DNA-binding CsgD family transcriptional regulator
MAKGLLDDRLSRADVDRLRARIEVSIGSAATAHHIFISAARAVSTDDPVRALEMRVAANLTQQFNVGISHVIRDPADPSDDRLARDGLPDDARTRCLHELLKATTDDAAHRWADAVRSLSRAVEETGSLHDTGVIVNVGDAALHLGDDDGHRRCFTTVLAAARDRGAIVSVLYVLPRLAFSDLLAGRWDRVRDAAEEGLTLATSAGQKPLTAPPLAWLTLLAALQGDEAYPELEERLSESRRHHLGVLGGPVHDLAQWAAGIHAAHDGDVPASLHHLSRMQVSPIIRTAALDRLDAAVKAGDQPLTQEWTAQLSEFADATAWPWAHAAAAYGQALLAPPGAASARFDTALAHHAAADRPYELARTHLAYGELLRRSQRRVDARAHLRTALTLFDDLGAEPDAARARRELRASGETARQRTPSTLTALTPTELQVVQLVAQGMSNKDVAGKLWISPRTVAFHLRGAFAKLGVSSRGELHQFDLPNRNSD